MAKPLYYRSTNPGLAGVTARANKLFEWDGTGSMPTEIQNGKAFMPPAEISGETVIWSDTYTLGYTDEANAAPVFFSDGAAGEVKVLEMINHIAGRLDQALFADLVSAKAWIASVQGVDFVEAGAITVSNKVYDIYSLGNNLVNDEWLPGMMNYISSAYAGQAWPSALSIPVNVIDANGVNRQAELLAATSIKIYHDASNYVTFDVTSASVNTFNGYYNYPPYDADPSIVNTVVELTVTNMVAVGVAPSVENPSVTLLINGENPASGSGSGVVTNAYSINLDTDGSGNVIYHDGYLGGFSGGGSASAWPASTQIGIARIDAFGNDRLADFQNATQIRVEVDASNYAVYNVSNVQLVGQVFINGTYPFIQAYTATLVESAGLRPAQQPYGVNPQFVTVSNPAAGAGSGSATTYTHTVSNGDASMIIENNSSYPVSMFEFNDENGGTLLPYGTGILTAASQAWMPLEGSESVNVSGVHRWNAGGTMAVSLFLQFDQTASRRFKQYVNDVLVRTDVVNSPAFGTNFFGPSNTPVQAGDVVKYVIENA